MRRATNSLLLVGAMLAAACGGGGEDGADDGPRADTVLLTSVEREVAPAGADTQLAGAAVTAFGADLLASLVESDDDPNVVVSPLSVAVVLAMIEPGAGDTAKGQLHDLLGIDDPDAFHASMSALEQRLLALSPPPAASPEEEPGELTLRLANRAYLQDGYPFEDAYLDAVGRHYGPVLHGVDHPPDPDAVAREINAFVDEVTNGLIPELLADGVLTRDTVLTLVNALYLKASWLTTFEAEATEDGPFTRADGSEVTVPFLHGTGDSSARGDGWVGATKSYVGGLSAQMILPDDGRLPDLLADLPGLFEAYDAASAPGGPLALPRFETRFAGELSDALEALGLTAPYAQGNLRGIAPDDRLVLTKVVHETFLAVDEEGTEAAAATAAVFAVTGMPIASPIEVVLDRPFILRIFDPVSGATLFLGLIGDPTA